MQDFIDDVRLVWSNCILYNGPDTVVPLAARRLEEVFERKLSEITEGPSAGVAAAAGRATAPALARVPTDGGEGTISASKCRQIVKSMVSNQNSIYFRVPVDHIAHNIPTYPDIIKRPMDVRTRRRDRATKRARARAA